MKLASKLRIMAPLALAGMYIRLRCKIDVLLSQCGPNSRLSAIRENYTDKIHFFIFTGALFLLIDLMLHKLLPTPQENAFEGLNQNFESLSLSDNTIPDAINPNETLNSTNGQPVLTAFNQQRIDQTNNNTPPSRNPDNYKPKFQ